MQQKKVTTALLLTLKAATLKKTHKTEGWEYPISGDALALLTGPAQTTVNIWDMVTC